MLYLILVAVGYMLLMATTYVASALKAKLERPAPMGDTLPVEYDFNQRDMWRNS